MSSPSRMAMLICVPWGRRKAATTKACNPASCRGTGPSAMRFVLLPFSDSRVTSGKKQSLNPQTDPAEPTLFQDMKIRSEVKV